jgi:manganese/iron transport system permease protein
MDFLSYVFLQKALAMAIIAGATCGAAGVFIVLWRVGFMGICVSHAAFAGALIGLWVGVPPLAGGMIGSLGAASVIGPLADRPALTPDTAMGVVFSVMLSLAMLALALLPGARSQGLDFLWGSLLTVTNWDLVLISAAALMLLLFIVICFKEIQATISQRRAAIAMGIPAKQIYYFCLCLLGFIIAVALKAIGGILIYALVVTPAATALQLTYSLKKMFVIAAAIGMVSSIAGLWISFHWAVPTGAAIVLTATAFLIIAMIVSPKRRLASV